jgi:hypothetical protein
MRLILDSALFDVKSQAEARALVDLFITVTRDTHQHALFTDPPYLPGVDNGPIDAWLASHSGLADLFRALLANMGVGAGPQKRTSR